MIMLIAFITGFKCARQCFLALFQLLTHLFFGKIICDWLLKLSSCYKYGKKKKKDS